MPDYQVASWHALMDLHESLPGRWTIVGGQSVHLHCAERGAFPIRPTDDADALLDVKAHPSILEDFTAGLFQSGFEPRTSDSGHQHLWRKGDTQIDVLISDKLGMRKTYLTVTGAPTVGTRRQTRRTFLRADVEEPVPHSTSVREALFTKQKE